MKKQFKIMYFIKLILFLLRLNFAYLNDACNRNATTGPKISGDNGFRIKIFGNPEQKEYIAHQEYEVTILGAEHSKKFNDIYLVAVSKDAVDETNAAGHFQHALQTSHDKKCPHIIVSSNPLISKSGIDILWTAPHSGYGCVEFRVTVILEDGSWIKDEGSLKLTMCEKNPQTSSSCCACGSAKYQMTFTSLWNSHHGDMKQMGWSNITGSTHTQKYVMWMFGHVASKGLKKVCLKGISDTLEEEMRQHIQNIRTVVKTTGIEWNEEYGMQQSRWSHFSVDENNHLLSLVTKIFPSPGWCAGVSSLNLCQSNCSWIGGVSIDLFPWTAGSHTLSGTPGDVMNQEVKLVNEFNSTRHPIAILKIKKLLSTKNEIFCRNQSKSSSYLESISSLNPSHNFVNRTSSQECIWSQWTACSSSCGWGTKERLRISNCDGESANAQTGACYGECQQTTETLEDCKVNEWTPWSECSCFKQKHFAIRSRKRSFAASKNIKSCRRLSMETKEEKLCDHYHIKDCTEFWNKLPELCKQQKLEGPCKAEIKRYYFDISTSSCMPFKFGGCSGNSNKFATKDTCLNTCMFFNSSTLSPKIHQRCFVDVWSQWSICSQSCGTKSFRSRARVVTPRKNEKCSVHKRMDKQKCPKPKCCVMDSWTQWTPCSQNSCGILGVQERTRNPLVKQNPSENNKIMKWCVSEVERKACLGQCL